MILLFGAGGQVGQEVMKRFTLPRVGLLRLNGDINAPQAALDKYKPTIVMNAAAFTAVDKAETAQEEAFRANVQGVEILAQETHQRGIPLIHLSTDYVFDGSAAPYDEQAQVKPLGVYGQTKWQGEEALRAANPNHYILRTSWVYGQYGANFLKTMLRLAQERDEIRVVHDQFGRPTATQDIAHGLEAICQSYYRGEKAFGTYHFAGSKACTWYDFACEILRAAKRETQVTPIPSEDYPTPVTRPKNSDLVIDKFIETFHYQPQNYRQRIPQILEVLK
jgi:dTDP-4-dehydrorhamnose reductase